MKILVIDNYDSFTFNLVHYLMELAPDATLDVFRNDKISIEAVGEYDKIMLSPGPGIPEEAGIMKEVIRTYAAKKSILGICLGHQGIAEVFGGKLLNMERVYHGVSTPVRVTGDSYIFSEVPEKFDAGRYHSWLVKTEDLPKDFEVIALDMDDKIMGIQHKDYDLIGLQFHPESVMTTHGKTMIKNWLKKSIK